MLLFLSFLSFAGALTSIYFGRLDFFLVSALLALVLGAAAKFTWRMRLERVRTGVMDDRFIGGRSRGRNNGPKILDL